MNPMQAHSPRGSAELPEGEGGTDRETKRRGIQSIEIGFGILEVLVKAGGPIALKTIAERSAMPVANVHNYLVSFQKVGVVVQEKDTGYYGLGAYALRLGIAAIQQFDVHKVARPVMAELSAKTGFSAFLGVWGNKGPTIVYRVESTQSPPLMELRVGSVLPLLTSALGRNFLSYLPAHMTSAMLKQELTAQHKQDAANLAADIPRSPKEVEKLIERVRENGFSSCEGSFLPGYTTVSAPIFDQLGGVIAGLTLMGVSSALVATPSSEVIQLLRYSAAHISTAGGWHG